MAGPDCRKRRRGPKIPRWVYTLVWIAWILVFAVFETLALLDPESGNTLSEHVWYLTSSPVLKMTFAGFLLWLILHLFKLDRHLKS